MIKSISELLPNIENLKKTKGNQRGVLIQEIYDIYISSAQKNFRKKENWKRYCQWCRDNRVANTLESQSKFRKSKLFIREHPIKTICFFLSHIPTADLHYISSVAWDMQNRNQNFSGYFMSSIRVKNEKHL